MVTATPSPRYRARAIVSGVGVLDRSVWILSAVEAGARSFTDVVEATGLTRSTAHRLIAALEEHRLLVHVEGLGYALGPQLLALGTAAARDLPLRELARPALERLARSTGESAQIYVREGDRRVCIHAVESDRELRTIVEIGASLPLDKGSAGKVFLAWGTERDRARLAARGGRLSQQVAATRRRGWADSVAEREPGVASLSAPVRDGAGTVLGAVSISGPVERLGRRPGPAVVGAVLDAAAAIGRAAR
jgi:DNA-binding IclR family transcriptional regulator